MTHSTTATGDGYHSARMEHAHYWAAELLGWMENGPNAGLQGTYYVDILGGKPVLVMDGDEWSEYNATAIRDSLLEYGFPQPTRVKVLESHNEIRLFISEPTSDRLLSSYHPNWREFKPTGGDGGDPAGMFEADQLSQYD